MNDIKVIMMDKLKPCPFCGCQPEKPDRFNIYCSICNFHINEQPHLVEGAWNTRTEDKRIKELEADYKKLLKRDTGNLKRLIAANEQLDAVREENSVLRWVIWQHCEMADSKIAHGCQRWGIPFKPTSKKALGENDG